MFICSKQETQEYTKTVVRYCLDTLQTWFDAIGFIDEVNVKVGVFCLQVAFLLFLIAVISFIAGSKSSDISPATTPLLCHVPQ